MTGGKGNDTYYVDSKDDKIAELSGQGTDLIYSDISLNLFDKALLNVEKIWRCKAPASLTPTATPWRTPSPATARVMSSMVGRATTRSMAPTATTTSMACSATTAC